MKPIFQNYLLLIFIFTKTVLGVQLPTGISPDDLNPLIKTLALGNVIKLLRSAEPYPSFPGLKISLETTLIHSGNLNEMGDGSASLPMIIPSPRIIITKGLGKDLETSMTLSTQSLLQTMASVGLLGKWTFLHERDSIASGALFLSYTQLSGFKDTFKGKDFEIGLVVSRDYVRIKPYVGLGLLLASGTVSKSVSPLAQQETVFSPHLFVGTEIELPMNVALQLDFTDLVPTGSLSLGYRF